MRRGCAAPNGCPCAGFILGDAKLLPGEERAHLRSTKYLSRCKIYPCSKGRQLMTMSTAWWC